MKHWILLSLLLLSASLSAQSEMEDVDTIAEPTIVDFEDIISPQKSFVNPLYYRGLDGFGHHLHSGLNASVSLSATVGLGKNAPSGVGFGKDLDFAYVLPLSNRWSAIAGLYLSDFTWDKYTDRELGFSAMLSYHLSENVTLSAYGKKSLIRNQSGFPLCPWDRGDFFGGRIDVKVSDHFSFGVAVEKQIHPENPRIPDWQRSRMPRK